MLRACLSGGPIHQVCSISLGTLGPAQHHHMGRAQPSGHIIAQARGEWEEHSRGDSGRHTGPSCCGSLICCHQERRGCGVGVSCLTLRLLPPWAAPLPQGTGGPPGSQLPPTRVPPVQPVEGYQCCGMEPWLRRRLFRAGHQVTLGARTHRGPALRGTRPWDTHTPPWHRVERDRDMG